MSRRLSYILTLFFLIVLLLPDSSKAAPLDNWSPLPHGDNLRAIAYANNSFVIVGDSGTILTSPDGITWTRRFSGTDKQLSGVTYGNDEFVIVGDSGAILTSPDGITWVTRFSGTNEQLSGITYGNNTFVAVGSSGTILTSSDGITWVNRPLGPNTQLSGVTFGNNTFVAVGSDYGTSGPFPPVSSDRELIITSPDGITWGVGYWGRFYNGLSAVTYGKNMFVSVGDGTILTSPDGISWADNSPVGIGGFFGGVTYGNNTFVVVGGNNAFMLPFPVILTSADGRIWTNRLSSDNLKGVLDGVTYGSGTFIAVGDGGTILDSGPVNGNCTATLVPNGAPSNLALFIPVLSFNGAYMWATLTCGTVVDGSVMCVVRGYGAVNSVDFSDCEVSTISSDAKLHIPFVTYNNLSFEADFEYVPTTDGQIWVKLLSAIKN